MSEDLAALVDRTIDEAIRTFDPDEPNSFDRLDSELQRLESLLRENALPPNRQDLLATVQAKRIALASEIGRFDLVLEQSSDFPLVAPAGHPSFSNVAILRIYALHATGAHEAEVQESLGIARMPEINGSEYVILLANLSKRHPGRLPAEDDLWQKLQQSIEELRNLGYDTLPHTVNGPAQLEEMAGRVADELRRVNREKGEALLNQLP